MRVIDIVDGTIVDGIGLRTSVYFAGCKHRCPGCHNQHTWDFDAGRDMSVNELLEHFDREGFNVTLTGGDPFYQAKNLLPLVQGIKRRGLSLWCYTGFTYEAIMEGKVEGGRNLLDFVDVLVDGPFIMNLRDTSLLFRGSSNQRLVDVPTSLKAGEVVLFKP